MPAACRPTLGTDGKEHPMTPWRANGPGTLLAALGLLVGLFGEAAVPAANAQNLTASSTDPTVFLFDTQVGETVWDVSVFGSNLLIGDYTGGVFARNVIDLASSADNELSLRVDSSGNVHLADGALSVDRALGRVGIGTAAPQGNLHIIGGFGNDLFSGMGPDLVSGPAFNFGYAGFSFGRSAGFFNVRPDALAVAPNPSLRFATANVVRMIIDNQGFVGLGAVANPVHPLQLQSGAHVTAGGVWTDASSREYKQDIESLTPDEARIALAGLDPVKFAYKSDPAERHVGFVAEDVPALVATADRKGLSPMDIVAVLTRMVQEQQRTIEEQRRTMQAALAKLEAEVAALQRAVRH
jgi:hypothetical protein